VRGSNANGAGLAKVRIGRGEVLPAGGEDVEDEIPDPGGSTSVGDWKRRGSEPRCSRSGFSEVGSDEVSGFEVSGFEVSGFEAGKAKSRPRRDAPR
jgi:hypothetical protein